jgi:hypothetical protein
VRQQAHIGARDRRYRGGVDAVGLLILAAVLVVAGTCLIVFRHYLSELLVVFVPWADTAYGRVRLPQGSFALSAMLLIVSAPLLARGALDLLVFGVRSY